MSVLNEMYAAPARIAGVFNYLLNSAGHTQGREELENVLSPTTLRTRKGERGELVKGVIDECLRMGLIKESDAGNVKTITLADNVLKSYGEKEFSRERFRALLTSIIISDSDDNPNEDLCTFLAWYIAQDIYTMHGDWDWMNQRLTDTFGQGRMGFTDITAWRQFEFWAIYLGLAWRCSNGMFPDPTRCLSGQLEQFRQKCPGPVLIEQFLEALAEDCPIFQRGLYYQRITQYLPHSPENVLCSALSHALIRLSESGMIDLIDTKADAHVVLLRVSAKETARYDRVDIKEKE